MDKIDAVLYINLKHRIDRRQNILKELEKIGVDMSKVHRIDAVEEKLNGHLGCGKSHCKTLEYAIENNYDNVLILEDDFRFTQSKQYVNDSVNVMLREKFDVLMLTTHWKELIETKWNHVSKVISATTTSGYIVKKHYFTTLLKVFQEAVTKMEKKLLKRIANGDNKKQFNDNNAIDQYWRRLQKEDTFYVFTPYLGKQDGTESDIMKRI